MYKPGKVITSVGKKEEERNITFVSIISANAFQIKWILWLKNQKNSSETIYPKIDITENMCDYAVEYWQLSINSCKFFNFLWNVTGKCYHFLRFNYLEMCYFHVYLHICETQVHSCTGSAIFGIPHSKF